MGNFFKDNDDLKFYVDKWIDWEPLVRLTENDFNYEYGFDNADDAVGFYRDVLEMIGKFVAEEIDPLVADMEREHPELVDGEVVFPDDFDEIFDKIAQLDLHGMCVPRELGGMNAPLLVYMIQTEVMGRADVSISAHHSFHGGIAMALLAYSIDEQTTDVDPETGEIASTRFQDAIEDIMAGEAWGSMDITEPGAGSDMAAMRTKAEQDEDGNWYVTGQKIFITSGHGKYHVVIARTEEEDEDGAFSGLDKLSTFLVPAYTVNEDGEKERLAEVVRLEEKMGHHLSATCAVSFEKTPAYLIGERGEGFKQMLLLMNNARVGVSFECLGLCEAAYRMARDYAEERESMGKTIDRHEMIADYLEDMKTWIYGIRAITMEAGWYEEMAQKLRMQALRIEEMGGSQAEIDALRKKAKKYKWKARELTPLCKYIGAEKAVDMARMNIQIHGGSGYTQEYGAEKLLRDAVVMPIYEGTSQIQALMAMKDAMSTVMRNPQKFIKKLAQTRWRALSSRDENDRRLAKIENLVLRAKQFLVTRTAVDKFKSVSDLPMTEWLDALKEDWDPKRDFAHAMLHAERLTKMLTDLAICKTLYKQQKQYPERAPIFESFIERAEPRCRFLFDEITTTGDRLIERLNPQQLEEAAE
jgi:hypothetical protein